MKFGLLRLRIFGFNQMRLIRALTDESVQIHDFQKISAHEMCFSVQKKHSGKTFAILEKMCYNYKVEARSDLPALGLKALARVGLIVGTVVFSVVLTLLFSLIWNVEIVGNEKVDDLTIERTLASCGVARYSKRKNLELDKLRNVLNSIDGVLESSVELSGGTVRVEIVEDTQYVPQTSPQFSDICAEYDATVSRIITKAGTAQVQIGSRVQKGETLIGAYRTDAEGNRESQEAKGEVYGKVAFTRTETFSVLEQVAVRTGRTYKSSCYKLFGLNMAGKEKHGFDSFETETETVDVFSDLFIPLKLVRTVFYETVLQEQRYDPTERAEYFLSLTINEIAIKAGGSDIDATYTIKQISENDYRVTVYLQAEILIGKS